MRLPCYRLFSGKTILLVWAFLCILIFAILPGRVTFVQWSNLAEWQQLVSKLGRLNPLQDLIDLLWSFTGLVFFSAACISLGVFVLEKMKVDQDTDPPNLGDKLAFLATGFLLGHAIFSSILLTLSGIYRLIPIYTLLVLSAGLMVGLKSTYKRFLQTGIALTSSWKENKRSPRERILLYFCAGILFFSTLYTIAQISYDSTAVYFSDAKLTAYAQHISFFTYDSFVASLFHSAIQYTALIQLFGDQSARMISWMFGIVFIIFTLALGQELGMPRQAHPILLVLLLTSTAFLDLLGDGKVDIMSSVPAIAAIYWIVVESRKKIPSRSLQILAGLLTGFAIVARPFNAFLLGIIIILFYLQRIYLRYGFEPLNYKALAGTVFWMGIGVLGFGVFHLFVNWMIFGDPLAFLTNISNVDPTKGPWDYNPEKKLFTRLLLPLVATYYNSPQTLGNITPLLVAFLPAILLPSIRNQIQMSRELYIVLIISVITLLLWIFLFFTVYEIRYVFFLWAILFIPIAILISSLLDHLDDRFSNITFVLILALLVFFIFRTIYIPLDTYSPVDHDGNPQCFCDYLGKINESASLGDRVLTLSAFRYYLRSDLFACSTGPDEYIKLRNEAKTSSETFWLEVYRQGYKFVLYEKEYADRHLQLGFTPSPDNTPAWIKLQPVFGEPGDHDVTYQITYLNPPGESQKSCQQGTSEIWEVRLP